MRAPLNVGLGEPLTNSAKLLEHAAGQEMGPGGSSEKGIEVFLLSAGHSYAMMGQWNVHNI